MLELALNGAKILQARSVSYAMNHHVKIRVASSFIESVGTLVSSQKSTPGKIVGISVSDNLVTLKIHRSVCDEIIPQIKENFIRIIAQEDTNNCRFITVNQQDLRPIYQIIQKIDASIPCDFSNSQYSNISIVGLGIGDNPEIIEATHKALGGFSIQAINRLQNSINIIVDRRAEPEILDILHKTFIR